MNVSISNRGHGGERPIETVNILCGYGWVIDPDSNKPAIHIWEFALPDREEEAGNPVSNEGNQYDQLQELDYDVHCLRGDVLFQPYEDPVQSQHSQ